MKEARIKELLSKGEGISIEFKECGNKLNKNVFESICAFLKRNGGDLLLGVNDRGEITGIDLEAIERVKKGLVTALNNTQKLNTTYYLMREEVLFEGKRIIHLFVPESSQVHSCNGKIYDRNEDGDLDITDHTRQVADLYQRKQATYLENKIYPFAKLEDLRYDIIDKCRRLAGVWRDDHFWLGMDDRELLKSAQLDEIDAETGEQALRWQASCYWGMTS